eukprot:s1982_g6.t1
MGFALDAVVADLQDGDVLSAEEKAQFVLAGFVKVCSAVSRSAADAAAEAVWAAAELQEQSERHWPSSWERGDVMMKQQIPSDLLNSKKLHAALDDLLGSGRWSTEGLEDLGWAPMRFPASKLRCRTAKATWDVENTRVEAPCQYHLDGSWYQHRLFCPQQAVIICVILTDTAMGGAGTAVKLASHFHMAQHLVEAGEDGLDHASLCREAQALDVEQHPEYEIYCNAGDVLLLHPHLAHSSTTNVRFGRDVRLALTKRAYWTTGPATRAGSLMPVEFPLSWAATKRTRQELDTIVENARRAVMHIGDSSVIPWQTLKEELILEAPVATIQDVDARLAECAALSSGSESGCNIDVGCLLLTTETLQHIVKVVAKTDDMSKECCLGLARCGLGPAGSSALGRLLQAPLTLKRLLLQGNAMGDGGVVALLALAAETLRAVETLSLSSNELTEISLEALVDALGHSNLQCLKLNDNSIGAEGADALARLVSMPSLRHLELRNCPIKDEGILTVKENLESSHLEVLDLERTRLSDPAAVMLSEMLIEAFPFLRCLSLRACRITDQGAVPLLRAACGRSFQRLDLGRNFVGDGVVKAFADLLPDFEEGRGLEELLLGTNQVTDVGIEMLCDGLVSCRGTVRFMNFTSNLLKSQSLQRMTAFLDLCCSKKQLPLWGLDLTYNDMSVELVQQFRAAVGRLSETFSREDSWKWERCAGQSMKSQKAWARPWCSTYRKALLLSARAFCRVTIRDGRPQSPGHCGARPMLLGPRRSIEGRALGWYLAQRLKLEAPAEFWIPVQGNVVADAVPDVVPHRLSECLSLAFQPSKGLEIKSTSLCFLFHVVPTKLSGPPFLSIRRVVRLSPWPTSWDSTDTCGALFGLTFFELLEETFPQCLGAEWKQTTTKSWVWTRQRRRKTLARPSASWHARFIQTSCPRAAPRRLSSKPNTAFNRLPRPGRCWETPSSVPSTMRSDVPHRRRRNQVMRRACGEGQGLRRARRMPRRRSGATGKRCGKPNERSKREKERQKRPARTYWEKERDKTGGLGGHWVPPSSFAGSPEGPTRSGGIHHWAGWSAARDEDVHSEASSVLSFDLNIDLNDLDLRFAEKLSAEDDWEEVWEMRKKSPTPETSSPVSPLRGGADAVARPRCRCTVQ